MCRVHQQNVRAASPVVRHVICVLFLGLGGVISGRRLAAEPPPTPPAQNHPTSATAPSETTDQEPSSLSSLPVAADPELEAQLTEVEQALQDIRAQIVRHKQFVNTEPDPAAKANRYQEIEQLRIEHNKLEALLHALVDEAKASERTAIDEALARARSVERQQEQWQQKEELLRERR